MNTITIVYALLAFVTLAVPTMIFIALRETKDELVIKVTKLAKAHKLNREQAEIYTAEEWPELSGHQRSQVVNALWKSYILSSIFKKPW